jgi:hypothetical protein
MSLVLPDTNIVIGRVKQANSLSSIARQSLRKYPGESIRLTGEVYLESSEMLQRNTKVAIQNVLDAYTGLVSEGKIDPNALKTATIAQVVNHALKIAGVRREAFYDDLVSTMENLLGQQVNPFHDLSRMFNVVVENELEKLKAVFDLDRRQPLNDCLVCNSKETESREQIEQLLRKRNSFFGKKDNKRDLAIISEIWIVASRHETPSLVFLTCDANLAKALEEVRPILADSHQEATAKVNVELLTKRR